MLYVNYLRLSLVAVTAVLFVAARWVLADEARPESREAYAFAALAGGVIMSVTGYRASCSRRSRRPPSSTTSRPARSIGGSPRCCAAPLCATREALRRRTAGRSRRDALGSV